MHSWSALASQRAEPDHGVPAWEDRCQPLSAAPEQRTRVTQTNAHETWIERPSVSVCLATYNGERYLRELVDSVLPQLGPQDELVVSDDASTDDTVSLLESYREPRIHVQLHEANQGYTRNFGSALRAARGDIIFFCDQDDVWFPQKIATMVGELARYDVAMCDLVVCDGDLREVHPSHIQLRGVRRGLIHNLVRTRYVGAAIAMRRGVLETLLPFPSRADLCAYDYWIALVAERHFRFKLLEEPLMRYRRHDATATTAGEASPHNLRHKIAVRLYSGFQLARRHRALSHAALPRLATTTAPFATVVAYEPDDRLVRLVGSLLDQYVSVLVVDNGSLASNHILDACEALGAEVDRVGDNIGIAAALNRGLQRAPDHGWLLTFDQDSSIDEQYVASIVSSPALERQGTAMVAPKIVDRGDGTVLQGQERAPGRVVEVMRAITSGALCSVTALRSVGGFRDDLFIDDVDFDVSARLTERGWRLYLDREAVLEHSLGEWTPRRLGPIRLTLTHHSKDRLYYRYRNFVLLLRDPAFRRDRAWVFRSAIALAYGPIKLSVFERGVPSKLNAIAEGIRDGILGRSGKRPAGSGTRKRKLVEP